MVSSIGIAHKHAQPHVGLFDIHFGSKRVNVHDTTNLTAVDRKLKIHHEVRKALMAAQPKAEARATDPYANERALLTSLAASCNTKQAAALKDFCTSLFQSARSNGALANAREQLGACFFLADRDLDGTIALLGNPEGLLAAFEEQLKQMDAALQTQYAAHQQAGLQNADVFLSIAKPLAAAKALITSSGQCNIAIANRLKQHLLTGAEHLIYEDDISRTMDHLAQFPSLIQALTSIQAPENPEYYSNTVIRSALGIDPSAAVTDVDARIVALSSLMSDLRQGPVGSCFATYFGIELLELRADKCLSDFAALMRNDELTRMVDGKKKDFDYVLKISDDFVQSNFSLHANNSLATAPGIRAALQQMGIAPASYESTVAQATSKLLGSRRSLTITPQQFIRAVAQQIDQNREEELTLAGKHAFSSQTNAPLLRAWESVIAGMAESRPDSLVRGKINSCIRAIFQLQVKPANPGESAAMRKINDTFFRTLNDSITVRFDPSISAGGVSNDGHSTEGAFVPYTEDAHTTSSTGQRIDTPEKFAAFALNTLRVTNETLQKNVAPKELLPVNQTIQKINNLLADTNAFLRLALINYDSDNRKPADPLKSWQSLEHTPWLDKTGDDNREVMDVYFERSSPSQPVTYTPTSTQDLLRFVIGFAREQEARYKYLDDDEPNQLYPCATPSHAFSLLPEHRSIVPAVKSSMSVDRWIAEYVVKPGMAVSNATATDGTRSKLVSYASDNLASVSTRARFHEAANAIKPNLSVAQFRSALLDALSTATRMRPSSLQQASEMLDTYLTTDALPDDAREQLKSTIVHFADTNWNDGTHDIHFCSFFNPGRQTVQFGTVDDNNAALTFAAEQDWVLNQQWDLYRVGLNAA